MPLKYDIRKIGEVTILDLHGRLSLGEEVAFGPGSGIVLGDIIRELTKKGQKKIVLDLEGVTYVDSSGVGQLIGAVTTARNQGGDVKLLGPTKQVRELLRIVKLDSVFDIHEHETAAIRSFSNAAAGA